MFGQCPHDVRALFSILPIALLSRQDPFPGLVLQGFVFVKLLPVSCSSTRGSRSCSSRAHIISWASSSRSISIRESTPDGAAAHRRSCGRLARRVPCRRDALARGRARGAAPCVDRLTQFLVRVRWRRCAPLTHHPKLCPQRKVEQRQLGTGCMSGSHTAT